MHDLLARCAAGDNEAWGRIVDRYSRLVYSVPRRYGFDAADCDDIHQSVFSVLHRRIGELRDPGALPRWLITTAHRASWRLGREVRSRPGPLTVDVADTVAESDVELLERRQAVHEALHDLGGRCERLLRMLFLDRPAPAYDTIGARLGIPVGSIGPTRARCLGKLSEILAERVTFPDLA